MLIPWLTIESLSAGDWPFLFKETMGDFSFFPLSWSNAYLGMGSPNYGSGLRFFFELTIKALSSLSLSWILIERLVWFWPFLILVIFSPWYLAKTFFPKDKLIQILAPFIYFFNTYILMIIGGGQVGVALAYALAPLVFSLFFKKPILAGIVLAFQLMFGPRMALVTMGGVFLYWFIGRLSINELKSLKRIILPILIAFGLHFFWILPTVLVRQSALPPGYEQAGWVEFFSFADFSNTLSFLHPNWPENIFGKTYFMRPEFLILPILAFSSLLFINQLTGSRVKELKNSLINNKTILYFNLLALIGAFLAKGTRPPLGGTYLWLFENIPGMRMFRDPTKFYLLIALAYSILIPYSLSKIYTKIERLKS